MGTKGAQSQHQAGGEQLHETAARQKELAEGRHALTSSMQHRAGKPDIMASVQQPASPSCKHAWKAG